MRSEGTIRPLLLACLAALFAATLCLVAAPAQASKNPDKLPLLYKGNGFKLKPGLIWGWDPDGRGKPLRYVGKASASSPAGDTVKWTTWTKRRAQGTGRGFSTGCLEGECELGYPWDGTRLKITATKPVRGHFTQIKMNTLRTPVEPGYYEITLGFRGRINPAGVSWRVLRVRKNPLDDPSLTPAASSRSAVPVYDGQEYRVKPASISGLSFLTQGGRAKLVIGGLDATKAGAKRGDYGNIQWKQWNERKAIGSGTGWVGECPGSCKVGNPWDGTRLRVTLYRNRAGRFNRMKVFQWSEWMPTPKGERNNYLMGLVFKGPRAKPSPWQTFAFDDGWPDER